MREVRSTAVSRRCVHAAVAAMVWLIVGCGGDETSDPSPKGSASFAVLSDLHFYDPTMGTSGDDFVEDVGSDRKLIAESSAILDAAADAVASSPAQLVLMPGDLTKDGTRQSHEAVVAVLGRLEAAGKRVYVVPGNHDIDNPHSYAYPPTGRELRPNISAADFEALYGEFGFAEAIDRDTASLSYVAEPQAGLWILAIDSCNYGETAGALEPETMEWIQGRLAEAAQRDISVIGMLHHGVVEHFGNMDFVFGEYLLEHWKREAEALADAGLKIVFTGHHHATDVSHLSTEASHIVDVQTGSTVTWSCPYRLVDFDLDAGRMVVENHPIETIDYDTGGVPFQQYAYDNLAAGLPVLIVEQLVGLGLPQTTAEQLEPPLTPTMLAYFGGDEPPQQEASLMTELEQMAASDDVLTAMVGELALNIWNDDTPDGNVTIDLTTGTVE